MPWPPTCCLLPAGLAYLPARIHAPSANTCVALQTAAMPPCCLCASHLDAPPGTLQDDLESLDYDEKHKPWYRRKQFWIIAGPLLISLVFVLAVRLPSCALLAGGRWAAAMVAVLLPLQRRSAAEQACLAEGPLRCTRPHARPTSAIACVCSHALQGTLYLTLGKSETLSKFEVWRLCYFIAG